MTSKICNNIAENHVMRIAKYILFYLNTALLIILTSCNSYKRKEVKVVSQMSFKTVDSLLGIQYKDSINDFSIRVPKLYSRFDLSDNQKKELDKLNIKSVYQGRLQSTGSLFSLLNLSKLNDSLFRDYTTKLGDLAKSSTFNSIDSFYSNNFFIKQYIIKSDSAIQLKVIVANRLKGHYQIDFYEPISSYNTQSSTIESVLGSIK